MRWRPGKIPLGVLDALPEGEPGHLGCFFGGGGSSGGSQPAGNTTTTQTTTPWSGQQGYLTGGGSEAVPAGTPGGTADSSTAAPGLFQAAANLYSNYTPQYYPDSTVAPFNATEQTGLGLQTGIGLEGNAATNSANDFLTKQEGGAFLPGGASFNPFNQFLTNNVMASVTPGLESQFAQGNRMNSPGAAYAVSKGVGDALGGLYGNLYQQGLSSMNQGAFMAPNYLSADLSRAGAVTGAGQAEQTQSQQQLNDLVNRFNYKQMLPYQQLGEYQGAVTGNYGNTSTLTQPYFANQTANSASNLLGGGMLGASLGSAIGGSGLGTGLGALGGALLFGL